MFLQVCYVCCVCVVCVLFVVCLFCVCVCVSVITKLDHCVHHATKESPNCVGNTQTEIPLSSLALAEIFWRATMYFRGATHANFSWKMYSASSLLTQPAPRGLHPIFCQERCCHAWSLFAITRLLCACVLLNVHSHL